MPFIPTPKVARVAVSMVADLHNIVNTLWFEKATNYTATDLADLAAEIETFWSVNIMPEMCTGTALYEIYALDASSPTGPAVTLPVIPSVAGGEPSAPASLASAMTVTFQSAARGRSGRGRVFLSGFGEAEVGATTFQGALVTAINTAFEDLNTYLTGTGSTHVVVSHYTNGAVRGQGETFPVISYRANSTIYKQGNRTR